MLSIAWRRAKSCVNETRIHWNECQHHSNLCRGKGNQYKQQCLFQYATRNLHQFLNSNGFSYHNQSCATGSASFSSSASSSSFGINGFHGNRSELSISSSSELLSPFKMIDNHHLQQQHVEDVDHQHEHLEDAHHLDSHSDSQNLYSLESSANPNSNLNNNNLNHNNLNHNNHLNPNPNQFKSNEQMDTRLFFLEPDEDEKHSLHIPMERLTTGVNTIDPNDAQFEEMKFTLKEANKILICLSAFCTEVQISKIVNRMTRFLGTPRLRDRSRELFWNDLENDIPPYAFPTLQKMLENFLTGKDFNMSEFDIPGYSVQDGVFHGQPDIDRQAKILTLYQAKALTEYNRKFPDSKVKISIVRRGIHEELKDYGYEEALKTISYVLLDHVQDDHGRVDPNIDNLETIERLEQNIERAAEVVDSIDSYLSMDQQRLYYHELMKYVNSGSIKSLNCQNLGADLVLKLDRDVVPQVVHQYLTNSEKVDEMLGDPSSVFFRRAYQRRTAILRTLCETRMRYGQIFITDIDSIDQILKTQLQRPSNELYSLGWNIMKLLEYKKYNSFKRVFIKHKMKRNTDPDVEERFMNEMQDIFGDKAEFLMDSFRKNHEDLTLEILAMCHVRMSSLKSGIQCYARNLYELDGLMPVNKTQIYVSDLPLNTTCDAVVDAFRRVGQVAEVHLFNDEMCLDDVVAVSTKKKRGRKPGAKIAKEGNTDTTTKTNTKRKPRRRKPFFELPLMPTMGAMVVFSTPEEAKLAVSDPLRLFGVSLPIPKIVKSRKDIEVETCHSSNENESSLSSSSSSSSASASSSNDAEGDANLLDLTAKKVKSIMCYPQPLEHKKTISLSVKYGVQLSKVLEDIREMVFPYADVEIHCNIPMGTVLTEEKLTIMFDKHTTASMIIQKVLSDKAKYDSIKSIRWETHNLPKFRFADD